MGPTFIFGNRSLAGVKEVIYGELGTEQLPGENMYPAVATSHADVII